MKTKLLIIIVVSICMIIGNVPFCYAATNHEVLSLSVSDKSVEIKHNGDSAYVDVTAKFKDGSTANVNTLADWSTSNQDVAFGWDGRILAQGKGKATITVSYQGLSKDITVKVLKTVDLKALMEAAIKMETANNKTTSNIVAPASLTESERDTIMNKAAAMCYVMWKPTKNLTGWKNGKTFYANTWYQGIPYTQANQVDETGFINSMSKSDFYTVYTVGTTVMPRYGNDCSGYVSFAWGLSRKNTWNFEDGITNGTYPKVGTYSNSEPTEAQLLAAYKLMRRGDAVVQNINPHTFIIGGNYSDYAICYEQTPYFAQITTHYHSDLAKLKYKPFSKK